MQNKLFEILSWTREDDFIIVNIDKNKYITNDTIVIHECKYENYLKKHDRLYYETHDMSTGQYYSKGYNLSMDKYFDQMAYDDVIEDLYDYISVKHIDFPRSWQITKNAIDSILSHLKL